MTPLLEVRGLDRTDLSSVCVVLQATGLFPPEMLAPMAEPYLSEHAPHHWLVACSGSQVMGFAYAEPERMTDGTSNLLAIAVHPDCQRQGVGKILVGALEDRLRGEGSRLLLVETSSLAEHAAARAFYTRLFFVEEARIRDFYSGGEDKIVFWKKL